MISISLIIPCYNEETNIQKGVLDKIGNFTRSDDRFIEVLIVDDGSTDKTRSIIREKYLPSFPKMKIIEARHGGKSAALITGIKQAQGDYVFFSDIDLATPIEESEKLIQYAEKGYDVIVGSRNSERKGAPLTRKIMAVGFIYIRTFLIGVRDIRDTQCGFKMFRRSSAQSIIRKLRVFASAHTVDGSSVSAGFDLEFLFIAEKLNYRLIEIPVTWRHVETKNVNFIKDSIETILDMLHIKFLDMRHQYEL